MKIKGYTKHTPGRLLVVDTPKDDPLPCDHSREAKAWGTLVCTRRGPGTEKTCCRPEVCSFYTRSEIPLPLPSKKPADAG